MMQRGGISRDGCAAGASRYFPPMTSPRTDEQRRFRRTLVRVLIVQVVTLLLLWLLQTTYGAG